MEETTITPYRDGPYLVSGPFALQDPEGEPIGDAADDRPLPLRQIAHPALLRRHPHHHPLFAAGAAAAAPANRVMVVSTARSPQAPQLSIRREEKRERCKGRPRISGKFKSPTERPAMYANRFPVRGQPLSATQFLPPRFELSEPGDSRPVLCCSGELDGACAAALAAVLDTACEREVADLLLDLSAVEFIDGRILALIAHARGRLERCGAALRIRAAGQPLRLLRLTGVIGGDAEDAPRLEAWNGRSSSSSSPTITSAQPGVAATR